MPVICRLCNRELGTVTLTHLKNKHNITMAEYREGFPDAPLRSPEAALGTSKGLKGKKGKPKSPEHRAKLSISIQSFWLDPEHREELSKTITTLWEDPEYRQKQSKSSKAKWEKDPALRQKHSKITKERWEDPDFAQNISQKCRQKALEYWSDPEWAAQQVMKIAKGMKRRPTVPELELFELLNKNGYRYVYTGDGGFWIGTKNPDFIWPEQHKLIEMYGSHPWHDESEIEPRTEYLANYGFDTLVIWDYELENPERLLAKLKAFHS